MRGSLGMGCLWLGVALAVACGAGCGGDDSGEAGAGTGGDMPVDPGPDPGPGVGPDPGPTVGPAADPCDSSYVPPTECGGTMCPSVGLASAACVRACCQDDKCGTLIAAAGTTPTECTLPPEDDVDCPPFSFGGFTLTGCCVMATNTCGLNVAGFLCFDAATALGMFQNMNPGAAGPGDAGMSDGGLGDGGLGDGGLGDGGMSGPMLPAPTDCDGNPLPQN